LIKAGELRAAGRKPHDPFRAETLQALAELYLRLNGYFSIRNFLQHRADVFGLDTETDALAMRMPYQEELLNSGVQPNDPELVLPARLGLADCLIVEVKEPSVEFNKPMRDDQGPERIATAIRMFGLLPTEAFERNGVGRQMAEELHGKIKAEQWRDLPQSARSDQHISVRMLVFAPGTARHAERRKHVDLQHVLDFTRGRMELGKPCAPYRDPQVPSISPWRGSTLAIVQTIDDSRMLPTGELLLANFIDSVTARLKAHR
jgi:hypothetical protein